MGFVTKQSVLSLLAGGGSGALLAYGVRRQRADPRDVYLIVGESGYTCAATFFLECPQRHTDGDLPLTATGVSAVLVVMMGLRFLRSRKFMPAGLVTVSSRRREATHTRP